MDWGLGNPNKTAALIATLMVGLWALSYIRKWGFWVALTGFMGLGICLVHTFSRGGVVALFIGLVPVLVMAPRPWPWKRIAGVVASVWIIIGFSIFLQAHERLGQGIAQEDRSISNRLKLWKSTPEMMLDAPGGWGLGNSGKAYMDWYQALDQHEPYRTMVNSHLTWLVEFGWPARFLYIAGWCAIFLVCLPDARSRWLSVPFGVWLAFFISAIFSSVAEEPRIWVIPVLMLVAAVAWRAKTAIWPRRLAWIVPPTSALIILLLIPAFWRGTGIQRTSSAVVMGEGAPAIWIVSDEKVLGSRYGRTLRTFKESLQGACLGLVDDLEKIPDVSDITLILTGKFTSDPSEAHQKMAGADSILLVNPAIYPQEISGIEEMDGKLQVWMGDFVQTPACQSWAGGFNSQKMAGIGDFVPDWPVAILEKANRR